MRRLWGIFAAAVAALLTQANASAQDYPKGVTTIIVPFAAGGPTDALARQIAASFQAKFGQSFVVENVSGGGSTIGTQRVARATPDGSTLLLHNLAISANVSLYPKLSLNPEKDLAAIGMVNRNPLVLAVRKNLKAGSIAELAEWMKISPTPTKASYPGPGSTGHLATALLAQAVGAKVDLIPYRGGAPALQDVIAENVDMFFGTPQAIIEPARANLVKALGVTARERLQVMPEVPSFVEAYGPKLDILYWHCLFAPAGTPRPIIDALNGTLRELLADPQVVKAWEATGVLVYPSEQQSPEFAERFLASEVKRWGDVIRENKIEAAQ